jgi:hypothetical protein
MECEKERIFKNTCVAVNVKTKKILSMKVTADEHIHDSKAVPELVENIIKSDNMSTTTTTTTTIGKLFGDDALMKVMRLLGIQKTMELCLVLK